MIVLVEEITAEDHTAFHTHSVCFIKADLLFPLLFPPHEQTFCSSSLPLVDGLSSCR